MSVSIKPPKPQYPSAKTQNNNVVFRNTRKGQQEGIFLENETPWDPGRAKGEASEVEEDVTLGLSGKSGWHHLFLSADRRGALAEPSDESLCELYCCSCQAASCERVSVSHLCSTPFPSHVLYVDLRRWSASRQTASFTPIVHGCWVDRLTQGWVFLT